MGKIAKSQGFSAPRNSDDEADVEGHGLMREGFTGSTKREGFTGTSKREGFTGTSKREGAILRSGETADDDVEGHGLKLRSPSSRGE